MNEGGVGVVLYVIRCVDFENLVPVTIGVDLVEIL